MFPLAVIKLKYYLALTSTDFQFQSRINYLYKPGFSKQTKSTQLTVMMETLQTLTIRRDIRRLRTLYDRAIQEDLSLEIVRPIVKELKAKMTELEDLLEKRAEELSKLESQQD